MTEAARPFVVIAALLSCWWVPGTRSLAADVTLSEVGTYQTSYDVVQIEVSPEHGLLFLREVDGQSIRVVDFVARTAVDRHVPTETFSDMDLTADSKYLFVADYGGERTGYGDPIAPHWVHRYDLEARSWSTAMAPKIAWRIEAVSPDRVLLQEHDQHVDMTLNSFGEAMEELSRTSADYYGDFEYDFRTGRVYHGSSGSSSREIHVRKVAGDSLQYVGSTGTYGTAQEGGGTCVLSTDGRYLFYGPLQVVASDVRLNLHRYPEAIRAASADLAFGDGKYYYSDTGTLLGSLGYSAEVYGVSEDGKQVWAFEERISTVHGYELGPSEEPSFVALAVDGPAGVGYEQTAQFRAIATYDDGSTSDVTSSAEWSIDRDIFGSIDANGVLTSTTRPGQLVITAQYTEGRTESATRDVECIHGYGESGVVELERLSLQLYPRQIEYAPDRGLLFLRVGEAEIVVVDAAERRILERYAATNQFSDMDLTADSSYLFVADYGGERTGYGDPLVPHYVHRLNLTTLDWTVAEAPRIAWRIEAVSPDRVLLQEHDQHVDMTLNSFGDSMEELSRIRADYYGDFEYDPRTGKVFHGSSGSSSQEIHVRRVVGDSLENVESSGTYGTAQGGGGTCVLSTSGADFYYGSLQVNASVITENIRKYTQMIHAASAAIAFGENRYYDSVTGAELSGLGYETTVYGISENGLQLWAYEPDVHILHHYAIQPPGGEPAFMRGDADADGRLLVSDAVTLVYHIALGGSSRFVCEKSGDVDDDGDIDITDVTGVLAYLFLGTHEMPAPGAACGLDPTPDALGCELYSLCP